MPYDGYQNRVRKYVDEERARRAQQTKTEEVKYRSLRVKMSLGCWIWIGLFAFLGYLLVRWILKAI